MRSHRIEAQKLKFSSMFNSSTKVPISTKAVVLQNPCCTLFFFGIQHVTNYFKNILNIYLKKFAVSNKCIIFVVSIRQNK